MPGGEIFNLRQKIKELREENATLKGINDALIGDVKKIRYLLENQRLTGSITIERLSTPLPQPKAEPEVQPEINEVQPEIKPEVDIKPQTIKKPKYPKGSPIDDAIARYMYENTAYKKSLYPGPVHEIKDRLQTIKLETDECSVREVHEMIGEILQLYNEGPSYAKNYEFYLIKNFAIAKKGRSKYFILLDKKEE